MPVGMNIIYLLFASTLLTALFSWHQEEDERLLSAWSDGRIRISLFEEDKGSKWSHRLVIEKDGATIRKWGRWENGVFTAPPSEPCRTVSVGPSELVSAESPRAATHLPRTGRPRNFPGDHPLLGAPLATAPLDQRQIGVHFRF
jgi:hypothetical protein